MHQQGIIYVERDRRLADTSPHPHDVVISCSSPILGLIVLCRPFKSGRCDASHGDQQFSERSKNMNLNSISVKQYPFPTNPALQDIRQVFCNKNY
jgi:hypothetical protein